MPTTGHNQGSAPGPAQGAAGATQEVELWRIGPDGPPAGASLDRVIVEEPVTVLVEDVGSFTLMCTPTELEALAVGFLHSEGLIETMDDVVEIEERGQEPFSGKDEQSLKVVKSERSREKVPDPFFGVWVRIADPSRAAVGRNMIVASSCGFCGARTIAKALEDTPPCPDGLRVTEEVLRAAMDGLRARQDVFRATGGAHAAAVFGADGELLGFAEDIGRHNALDKAIGKCLLERRPTRGCGAALSGRVSVEMVIKAARAGIELIAAVSAPSSLAVRAADRCNCTLCGFVRPGRANVYTHPRRIAGLLDGHGDAPGQAARE